MRDNGSVTSLQFEDCNCAICRSTLATPIATGRDYVYRGSIDECTFVCCADCGHIYLNPRPKVACIELLYPSGYASFSGKFASATGMLGRLKRAVMLRRIRKQLGALPAGARFLDIGCGDGELLEAVKNAYPELELHGLDWRFTPQRRDELMNLGIVLHEASLETARLPESSFALVTMNQLVEHLWEPRACLEKVRRILESDGTLVLATPDLEGYDRQWIPDGYWGGYYFPRHLNLFSAPALHRLLQECGLLVEEARSLVAPVVWCYSLLAIVDARFPRLSASRWLFDPPGVAALTLFSMADSIAIMLKLRTSNQMIVAKRR